MSKANTAMEVLTGAVTRRGFIGRVGAVPVAGVAATGAASAMASAKVMAFTGDYAITDGRVIKGYFASPRGRDGLDVVVVLPEAGMSAAATQAKARSFAAQGWLAIAPDLGATYRTAALGGRPALVAAMMRDLPRLKKLPRGSGKVIVAA